LINWLDLLTINSTSSAHIVELFLVRNVWVACYVFSWTSEHIII